MTDNNTDNYSVYWDNLPGEKYENMLAALVQSGLKYVNAPRKSEVSISFVDEEEIKELNREYRDIDEVTDVLSFPFTEPADWPSQADCPNQADAKAVDVPVLLGDIIICTDIARKQAEEYGHTFERELQFLLVHGLLHLAGYDHINPQDEQKMRKAQRDILVGP